MRICLSQESAGAVMLVIIFAKGLGLVRDIVLANYFGTSAISDAYLIAISVPMLIFYFIGQSLSTSFLPLYKRLCHSKTQREADLFANNILNCSMLLCVGIAALLCCFPQVFIKLFAAGFDQATAALAASFIRLSAFGLIIIAAVTIFNSYLHAQMRFLIPACISVPRNIVMMASIVCAFYIDLDFLGIGIAFAYVGELLLLVPFAYKQGFRYQRILSFNDENLKELVQLALPILLGVGVSQINKVIDKSLASIIAEGGISALTYASTLNNAVQEILVTGIVTILFAKAAALAAEGKDQEVQTQFSGTLNGLIFFLVPASFGIITLSTPFVELLLGRGSFDERSLSMTVGALCGYTVGLLFLAIRDVLVRVFYAYKETKIPVRTSMIAILCNIVLNFIFSFFLGLTGLALATSLAALLQCILLVIALKRKLPFLMPTQCMSTLIASVACAIPMTLAISALYAVMKESYNALLCLLCCIVCGAIIYLVLSLLINRTILLNVCHLFLGKRN